MAKKATTTQPILQDESFRVIESEQTILEEVIKPHVDDYISKRVKELRDRGFDNNRIAATLMIHKHIVDKL